MNISFLLLCLGYGYSIFCSENDFIPLIEGLQLRNTTEGIKIQPKDSERKQKFKKKLMEISQSKFGYTLRGAAIIFGTSLIACVINGNKLPCVPEKYYPTFSYVTLSLLISEIILRTEAYKQRIQNITKETIEYHIENIKPFLRNSFFKTDNQAQEEVDSNEDLKTTFKDFYVSYVDKTESNSNRITLKMKQLIK